VVWGAGDGVHLLAAGEELVLPGGELPLEVHEGKLLEVEIEASTRRADPGEPVTLQARLARVPAGEPLTFAWTFDDGEHGTGEAVTHRFARRGRYDVALGVTSPSDAVGASAVVTIQVGEPPRGPDRKGGGTNEREDAPDSGAATPPPAPAAPAPAAPAAPAAAGESGSGPPAAARREREHEPKPSRAKPASRPAPAAPALPVVEGELVSAPLATARPLAARTGRAPGGDALDVPPVAWLLAVAGVLLLAGWRLEGRWAR
jgi:hypothetical protein